MKINNPLTVIAVFSLLTEASAAVSLPYIDSEHQKVYVWFLVIFPSLLITLFFLTLNFNNKTLYTPADLSKAENIHEGTTYPPSPPKNKHTRLQTQDYPHSSLHTPTLQGPHTTYTARITSSFSPSATEPTTPIHLCSAPLKKTTQHTL